ncbi:MAG: thiamine-monophosphate kinase, partial [Abditibacteriota bacterium]|nr:thiamine-monophosphate kinase [Abditibacteriota bacterium]
MQPTELGDFGLIKRWARQLESRSDVVLGIGDDAAILTAIEQPVVTCDALVEGVHFRLDWTTPRALGRKAMAVNVSDIAAMGAHPVAAFVSIAVPAGLDVAFLDHLYEGFDAAAREWKFTLAGGDTTRSLNGLFLSITIVGSVPRAIAPLRR